MRKRVQRTISMLLVLVNILGLMPIDAFSTDVEASAGADTAIVTEAPAEAQPAPSIQEPAPQTQAPAEEESPAPSADDPAPAQEPEAPAEPPASQEPSTAPEPSVTETTPAVETHATETPATETPATETPATETPATETPAVTEEPETTEEPSAEDSSEEPEAEEPEEGEEEEDERPQGDPTADVETSAVWERTIPLSSRTGEWAKDLILVASSQIGYAESTRNFIYDEEGNQQGYTRYGAWYGAPYAEWCAMFVSFCLNYAGIPRSAVPYNASCPRWVTALSGRGMYASASSGYVPKSGDIIFFEEDRDGSADHVGIVESLTDTTITVIEGNCNKRVMRKTYSRYDWRIYGYGKLPENPDHPSMPAATLTVTAADGTVITAGIPEGALPEGVEMVVVPQSAQQVFASLLLKYGYVGNNAPTSAAGLTLVNNTTQGAQNQTVAQNTAASWEKLPAYLPGGKVHYLVKETDVTGYFFVGANGAGTGDRVDIGGVKYVEIKMAATSTSTNFSSRLYNYEDVIPVRVVKRDYHTNAQNLGGFQFSIYTNEGKTAYAKKGWTTTDAHGIDFNVQSGTNWNGPVIYLKPGQKYWFDEDNKDSLPTGWHFASLSDSGVIDLSSYQHTPLTGTALNNQKTSLLTRYIYNKKDPNIRINKKDWNSGSDIAGNTTNFPAGVSFKIYSEIGNEDSLVGTITSVNANSGVLLPPGTYYVVEENVPVGYLDPNSAAAADLYNSLTTDNPYTYRNGKTYKTITVTDNARPARPSSSTPNVNAFTFYNIPNKGNLKVVKYVDGRASTVIGFPITITYTENGVEKTQTVNSGASGVTNFPNLPVYNNDGTKITYTITENLAGTDFESDYYKFFDGQTAQLILTVSPTNKTVETQDQDMSSPSVQLKVENRTRIKLHLTKLKINSWQQGAGGMIPMLLPGAEIGLYVQQPDGSWKLTEIKTSDPQGVVTFEGVDREHNYALVELSSPDPALFPYQGGWKVFPPSKEIGSTIPAADLALYNYQSITSTYIADHPAPSYNLGEIYSDLYNANHWVQFHVTKWRDGTMNRTLTPAQFAQYLAGADTWPYEGEHGAPASNEYGNLLLHDRRIRPGQRHRRHHHGGEQLAPW